MILEVAFFKIISAIMQIFRNYLLRSSSESTSLGECSWFSSSVSSFSPSLKPPFS
jgi:hypothetical protein